MSFTRLLAAGRSIMGIRNNPSPYRMNQQNLLPKFAPIQKATVGGKRQEEAPGIASSEPAVVQNASEPAVAVGENPPPGCDSTVEPRPRKSKSNPMAVIASGLAQWTGRSRRASAPEKVGAQIQGELLLDRVKVVRNDLTDSDFELVAVALPGATASSRERPGLGVVWNRLSARLLRQAALEFNLVQKERGKLLS